MDYTVKVNAVKSKDSNICGFATVVLGDSFKIKNIAVLRSREQNLFISMPHYKTKEKDENNQTVYKDVCNPITAEFRKELYDRIIEEYERVETHEKPPEEKDGRNEKPQMPEFSVTVTPFERENSNIRGLARIYFEDCFIVNNVNVLQGREKLFVAMPSYKTKQVDENNSPIYQDICYPVTKEFREKLYNAILEEYEKEWKKQQDKSGSKENEHSSDRRKGKDGFATAYGQATPSH